MTNDEIKREISTLMGPDFPTSAIVRLATYVEGKMGERIGELEICKRCGFSGEISDGKCWSSECKGKKLLK